MNRAPLSLVLNYQRTAKLALNVLVGALEQDPATGGVPVRFVGRGASLAQAIARSLAELRPGRKG